MLLCQQANMQGPRTPWTFSSRPLYSYYCEEVSKPVYIGAVRVFLLMQIPTHRKDHKACKWIFQHSSLAGNKFKHVRWWAHYKCSHLCYLPKKSWIKVIIFKIKTQNAVCCLLEGRHKIAPSVIRLSTRPGLPLATLMRTLGSSIIHLHIPIMPGPPSSYIWNS